MTPLAARYKSNTPGARLDGSFCSRRFRRPANPLGHRDPQSAVFAGSPPNPGSKVRGKTFPVPAANWKVVELPDIVVLMAEIPAIAAAWWTAADLAQ